AARGSALLSVQLLSKDAPGVVNAIRPLLHTMASADGNQAVRRLAVLCLRNGSPQRETIVLLSGLADDDDQEQELRNTARTVAADRIRACRARSSPGRRARASPAPNGGRRPLPADGWRRSGGAGVDVRARARGRLCRRAGAGSGRRRRA